MTENKRFKLGYVCGDFGLIVNDEWIDLYSMSENSKKNVELCINKMNELHEENKKLKRENESLNSQLLRLDNEFFCQDCLTCRHSKSINIDVECAKGEKEYNYDCDFYEISEEWVE